MLTVKQVRPVLEGYADTIGRNRRDTLCYAGASFTHTA